MSHPKSGSISVSRPSPEEVARREKERRKEQQRKIAAAEERKRERQLRLEQARQEAYQRAQEREERKLQLEYQRRSELDAALERKRKARIEIVETRAKRLLAETERLEKARAGVPAEIAIQISLASVPNDRMPQNLQVGEMEAWCAHRESELEKFSILLVNSVVNAAVDSGKNALVAGLCQGIARHARSGSVVLASFDAAVRAQGDKDLLEELNRVRGIFENHEVLISDPAISRRTSEVLSSAVLNLANCRNLLELKQQSHALLGLFAAARSEVDMRRSLTARIEQLISKWEALPDSIPTELSNSLSDLETLTEDKVIRWERDCERVATDVLAREQRELTEQREEDRKLIAISLQQTLENLGYEVEPISHTLFTSGGRIYASKPEWNGHFVELKGNKEESADRLSARCVRLPDALCKSDPAEDSKRETEWCDDLHMALGNLREQGISFKIDSIDRNAPAVAPLVETDVTPSELVSTKANALKKKTTAHIREVKP